MSMRSWKIPLGVALSLSFAIIGIARAGWAQSAQKAPLEIAKEGYFYAGGKYSTINGTEVMSGQIYVEFQIPARQTHPYPIVFVHGLGQSGTNFTGTPDGREGWTQFFLREGYAVYVIDQAGRGRSAYEYSLYGPTTPPSLIATQKRFTAPERYNLWPQAHLHTQWPGAGAPGDPVFDQFFASQLPSMANIPLQVALNRDAIVALLEKIGPAIVLTHSQAGLFGWPVADARPDLVKAVVAVEPSGPPFFNIETLGPPEWFRDTSDEQRPWGITAVPLHYSPEAKNPSDLAMVRQQQPDSPDVSRCWLQKDPARRLPNLKKVPILVLTSEASYHAAYDHCTVKYLEQAGVRTEFIRLPDVGVHGNGHMMMLEKNSAEVSAVISRWLDSLFPPPSN
ncbi:MAG: alpha/beta hydrolase [Candidatus Acidiferrales bacterium]